MNSDIPGNMSGIAKTLHDLTSITTRCYKNDKRFEYFPSDEALQNIDDSVGPYMQSINLSNSPIGCITTPNGFVFGYVKYNEYLLVLGPVKATPSTEEELQPLAQSLDYNGRYYDNIIRELCNCPKMTSYTLVPLLAHSLQLLSFSDKNRRGRFMDLFLSSVIDISFYNDTESTITREHCSLEWFFEKIIEEGNLSAIEEWYSTNPLLHFSTTITKDPFRDAVDCFIMMTSLYAKAASRGGLDRKYTFQLQLNAITAAEQMTSTEEILKLQTDLAFELTREVAAIKKNESYSKVVQNAIQIINRDIYGNINTQDIAKELFVSRGHLSKKFHQETGYTLNDFILCVKIREAKKLLLHSPMSLDEISRKLGFSTQSYFTKVFREATGSTPRHYRLTEAD